MYKERKFMLLFTRYLYHTHIYLIKNFISNNPECNLKPIMKKWGFDTGYGRQILTGQDNMDGFFYACLKKNIKC